MLTFIDREKGRKNRKFYYRFYVWTFFYFRFDVQKKTYSYSHKTVKVNNKRHLQATTEAKIDEQQKKTIAKRPFLPNGIGSTKKEKKTRNTNNCLGCQKYLFLLRSHQTYMLVVREPIVCTVLWIFPWWTDKNTIIFI